MHGQHLIAKKITSFVEAGEDWEQVAKQVLRKMVREICTLSKDMDAPESIRKVVQKSVIRYMPLDVVNGPDFSKEI